MKRAYQVAGWKRVAAWPAVLSITLLSTPFLSTPLLGASNSVSERYEGPRFRPETARLTARASLVAKHPCVFASVSDAGVFTALGSCSADQKGHPATVDRFEADLRSGAFVIRQTDLGDEGPAEIPLTRSYSSQPQPALSQQQATSDRASDIGTIHAFGLKTEDPFASGDQVDAAAIVFQYDDLERIREARDSHANAVRYIYNRDGMLSYAFHSSGDVRHYSYHKTLMTEVADRNGVLVRNSYRAGVLSEQQFANGDVYKYSYHWVSGRTRAQSVTVTLPDHSERWVSLAGAASR